MKRRELMLLLGGVMVASDPLRAQQKSAMPVLGYFSSTSPIPPIIAAFH